MNIPESSKQILHCYSVPDGFIDWCRYNHIQCRILERFDGGGSTGFTIEFTDPVARARAAKKFPGWKNICFPSDGVIDHGTL